MGTMRAILIYTDAEYLRAALEQENLIEGTESQYGLYATSVDGEAADESKQEWWGYSVNGTFAELGGQPARCRRRCL